MDWKKFFDSIGMNGTKWQWRIIRWQHRAGQIRKSNNPFDISASMILLYVNLLLFKVLVLRVAMGVHGMEIKRGDILYRRDQECPPES